MLALRVTIVYIKTLFKILRPLYYAHRARLGTSPNPWYLKICSPWQEGVSWDPLDFPDNKDIVDLIGSFDRQLHRGLFL